MAKGMIGNRFGRGRRNSSKHRTTRGAIATFAIAILLVLGLAGSCSSDEAANDAEQQLAQDTPTESVVEPTPEANTADNAADETATQNQADAQSATKVSGALKVHFIDVGQGDSEFLELPDGKTMLIDAGESVEADVVAGYIENLGYSSIDYLVATHPHDDHIGGMYSIIKKFDIGQVWAPKVAHDTATYENFLDAVADAGLKIKTAVAGKTIFDANGCKAEILSPSEGASFSDLNDWSAVVKVTFGDESFLFTGDASSEVIGASQPGHVDVLKAGHHGSSTSTTKGLVSQLSPEFAVISCGANNQYGHPHQEALDALSDVTVYRTDQDGTVVATCDRSAISWKDHVTAPRASVEKAPAAKSSGSSAGSGDSKAKQAETTGKATGGGPVVYITKTGEKYHADGCSSLRKSKIEISLEDAKAQGYEPCKRCNPPV